MDGREAALAGLAEDVGQALLRYATRLRDVSPDAVPGAATMSTPRLGPPSSENIPTQDERSLRRLGASQRRVLEAVEAAGETGTTAQQVARVTELKSTNTPRMLKALAERGLVSSEGSNPIIWYAVVPGRSAEGTPPDP